MGTKSNKSPTSAKKPSRTRAKKKKIVLDAWIRLDQLPKRSDETKKWTPAMIRAAQMRASCEGWEAIAKATGLTYSGVSKYPSKYPNFEKLQDWFLEQQLVQYNRGFGARLNKVDKLIDELELKIMTLRSELDGFKDRFDNPATEPIDMITIRRGAFAASMALVEAIKAYAKLTGIERYNHLLAEYTFEKVVGDEGSEGEGDIKIFVGIPGVDESEIDWYDANDS